MSIVLGLLNVLRQARLLEMQPRSRRIRTTAE
jgi:hypothetical protein